MKLLLTSTGTHNQDIADSLTSLVGKPASQTKIAIVPTAANVEPNNKDWFLAQFTDLHRFGFAWVDVVDPSADGVNWRPRLEVTDAIIVGGGNTYHLLNQVRKTGLDKWVLEAIKTKVYVGISAGSILATPTITVAQVGEADENVPGITDLTGLGLVPFEVSPHTPEDVSLEENEDYAKIIKNKLYAFDNETGIKVVNGEIEFVGTGKHWEFN